MQIYIYNRKRYLRSRPKHTNHYISTVFVDTTYYVLLYTYVYGLLRNKRKIFEKISIFYILLY